MLLLILLATSMAWALTNWWKNRDKRKLYNQFKSDLKCWPIIGHGLYMTGTSVDRLAAFVEFGRQAVKCGGSTCIWLGNQMLLVMTDPVDIDVVLKKYFEKQTTSKLKHLLGDGIIFAPETALGIKFDEQLDISSFRKAYERHSQIQSVRLQPWLQSDLIFWFTSSYNDFKSTIKYLRNTLRKLIYEKREAIRKEYENPKSSDEIKVEDFKSILEYLIDTSNETPMLNDKTIQEDLLALMLASLDTTSSSVSFAALMLSLHQNIQEKVYKELKEYFGDSKRMVSVEDLPHLKYLEAVIKETWRLYPPLPVIVRNVDKAMTLPSGKNLVPGIDVLVNIWTLHRSEKYWGPDAELFKPERFLDGGPKHPDAYMPFSRGPRNCIGFQYSPMFVTSLLVEMLRKYRILPHHGATSDSAFDLSKLVTLKYDITLQNVDNFMIRLARR